MRESTEEEQISSRQFINTISSKTTNITIKPPSFKYDDGALKKMLRITMICTLFLIAEIVGGIMSNSLAILSDAAHLSSDLSGFIISIIALCISQKKSNNKYTFGYYRAEVLGALISVVTIWLLTGILLKEAIDRLINPSEIYVPVMLLTAVIGLICNLAMMKVLHSGQGHGHGVCAHNHGLKVEESIENIHNKSSINIECGFTSLKLVENITTDSETDLHAHGEDHSHDHGHNDSHNHSHIHSHSHDKYENNNDDLDSHEKNHDHDHDHHDHTDHQSQSSPFSNHNENVNIRAAIIHIIGDIIQSIGVVIASLIIYFKPEWKIVDPICTFIFSIIVIFTTINITKQCISILMEASPGNICTKSLTESLKMKFPFIISIHNMHIWSLSSGKYCINLHVIIDNKNKYVVDIQFFLQNTYKFQSVTIQVETKEESEKLDCINQNL